MQIVRLAAVPSQNFSATLGGQAVSINVYQLGYGAAAALYMDLISDGEPIFTARICRGYGAQPNTSPPYMCSAAHYEGFEGDFLWLDTQATTQNPAADPVYTGLGARWLLQYLSSADLEGAGLTA
jgi:hypothetical protein